MFSEKFDFFFVRWQNNKPEKEDLTSSLSNDQSDDVQNQCDVKAKQRILNNKEFVSRKYSNSKHSSQKLQYLIIS